MLQGKASSARSLIAYMSEASLKKGLAWTLCSAMALRLSNTMLKHLGVCRVAGGEEPPKSEGERERSSESGDSFFI